MDISISLPLDPGGFLRRQCPHCDQQFKWHNGPANAEAEEFPPPNAYYCPLCGAAGGTDEWWTHEQLAFIEASAAPGIERAIEDELADAFRGSKNIKYKPSGESSPVPSRLVESDDMQIVSSPCHSYEPIKVPADTETFHCLICGSAFAV